MLLHIVLLLSLIPSIRAICNRTCGAESVPYPFGFSSECKILLTCDAADRITIGGGDFQIRNITSDGILVDVRPYCNRQLIPAVQLFYGGNYAISSKTVLLVRNCSGGRGSPSECVIPTSLLAQQFDLGTCGGPGGDNVTCLSAPHPDAGFLTLAEIEAAGCVALFTAIGYESGDAQYLPSLVFRTVEIGWWLDGECRCAEDADCVTVANPANGSAGFRCACRKGFQGDGFADGDGCRRETDPSCNTTKYISGNCDGPTRIGLLIAGIVTGASLMAGLALACCALRRRRRRSLKGRSWYCSKRILSQASCSIPLYQYRDIERATNGFSESQMLGTGAYGTVYAGKLNDDKLVAIKKIKHRDNESMDQVMNEVKLLSSVSHPNLVRLLGCCIGEQGVEQQQILVYEFMPNGTLSQHLARERGPPLPWTVRLTVAAETAKAIAYLHSGLHHPPIYHRDIKSSNILLDHSFNSKVADFGLSRMGNLTMASHISTAPQGTPGYLDPQYHQDFHLSDKSDVYSFGVVLVEIITAMKVVDFNREGGEVNLAAMAIDKIGKGRVEEIMDGFIETSKDDWTLASIHKVAELAFRCLAFHRDMRPSMAEVADELEEIRISGWQPDDVFVSPASSLCSSASTSLNNGRRVDEKKKVDSPVSVQDPWFSHRSSPSSNSLLGSAVP